MCTYIDFHIIFSRVHVCIFTISISILNKDLFYNTSFSFPSLPIPNSWQSLLTLSSTSKYKCIKQYESFWNYLLFPFSKILGLIQEVVCINNTSLFIAKYYFRIMCVPQFSIYLLKESLTDCNYWLLQIKLWTNVCRFFVWSCFYVSDINALDCNCWILW